ncbi:hypothetical protein GCM10025867_34600 [Frondihabitans sucicola]|uniref:Uncharacterized protein n=1 Tax=Frondihabitans sucicola TaxID=1268041 RepID=A0ABM8GRX8_9MICO|nr:hypothetical protein GCM10025867_34600 [Frondihabitans sucicola]
MQTDAELGRVVAQGVDLGTAREIGDRPVDRKGRGVVVFCRDREVEAADRAVGLTKTVERLGAGHLVDEVEVDVEEVGSTVGALDDHVVVPHFFGQRSAPQGFSHRPSLHR